MNAVRQWRLAVIACAWMGLQAADAQIQPAPAFTAAQLSAPPTTDWITNGGTLSNQRYSPLREINRGNVGRLKAKWRTHLASGGGAQHSGQGQPIVHAGVIYITTGASDVLAVSVEKGDVLWRYEAKLDADRVRTCCGWVNRGVALGDGLVFVGRLDAQLVALDQRTGKPVWTVQAEDPLQGFSIVSAPLYYDGLVITGFGGGEHATRGRMKAFDAKTGKLVWTFHTIPGPGEFGHDSWPSDNDAGKYGGAPIWNTPAVDPQLGLLYFSTGNAWPDFNGSGRKGDNLFTVSIVALDVKTGKYRWHFQQVHHDIWDYDSPNPVILFEAPYQGRMRKGIAEVSKTGWVYILDRETGKPLTPIEERPVPQESRQHTAATQPYVIGDSVVPQEIDIPPEGFEPVNRGRIFTPFWDKVVLYKPQMGVNWPPSSYDPSTHRMFICGIDHVASSVSDMRPFAAPSAHTASLGGAGANPGVARRGTFTAMNLITNRIVWQQQWPSSCFNGTLATGGGLVFVGRSDGRFTALDVDSGNRLWQFQTDAGVAASASTFEHAGHQYVVVLSAGTQYGGGRKGDSLWLFSLDGTIDSLPPEGSSIVAPAPMVALPAGPANVTLGAATFRQFCVTCHGEQGTGGQGGGASLATIARDMQAIANTVAAGRNTMPAFRLMLTTEQLRDVAGYISTELIPAHPQ
ncbi:MAG: PQQ-binding-like beta-propeller repeat protein [Proteobacteria bacterium]|nr:PQQ-binding-like beta-propeller repeat protein [Pseudomonadota bacterium]